MKKAFTTSMDTEITKKFKIKCLENDKKMNEILEALMIAYVADLIEINEEKGITVK
ncbi:MAG: hypothetical protein ACRC17_08025 [Culicoidibacterales bacterium]